LFLKISIFWRTIFFWNFESSFPKRLRVPTFFRKKSSSEKVGKSCPQKLYCSIFGISYLIRLINWFPKFVFLRTGPLRIWIACFPDYHFFIIRYKCPSQFCICICIFFEKYKKNRWVEHYFSSKIQTKNQKSIRKIENIKKSIISKISKKSIISKNRKFQKIENFKNFKNRKFQISKISKIENFKYFTVGIIISFLQIWQFSIMFPKCIRLA